MTLNTAVIQEIEANMAKIWVHQTIQKDPIWMNALVCLRFQVRAL